MRRKDTVALMDNVGSMRKQMRRCGIDWSRRIVSMRKSWMRLLGNEEVREREVVNSTMISG